MLVSGAAQREEEHKNLRGTAGGTKQAGRMHAALWKGRQMSSVADTKTREPGDFSSSSRKWRLPTLPRCNAVPSAMLGVWALLPSPRGSAAPLCARLRLYPAPLMHREDNGAAHSWDITKKGSLKKKLGLSLFSSGATKINSSTLGVRGLASFLSHSEERCEAS